jgi:hypothetical protein
VWGGLGTDLLETDGPSGEQEEGNRGDGIRSSC